MCNYSHKHNNDQYKNESHETKFCNKQLIQIKPHAINI